jgi:hypothetical protein
VNESLRCMALWFAAVAVALLLGSFGPWLDGPSETDAAAATALNLNDAIADARAARKEKQ